MKKRSKMTVWLGLIGMVVCLMTAPQSVMASMETVSIPGALEIMKQSNQAIKDMTCLFVKTITKNGKSFPETQMQLRYIKEPETIYLEFINPYPGQKCLYVKGENNEKLKVRPSGFFKFMTFDLDPLGDQAMAESIDPIMSISFDSVIRTYELFYKEAINVPTVTTSVKMDVSEDNDLYHLLMIQSDTGEYFNMFIHRKTCLPYKIQYKRGSDMATYIYKDLVANTDLKRDDFTI